MCACESTTASMPRASKGNGSRLRASASRPPWIIPQSSRSSFAPIRMMWQEPVTSPAAPKNSSCMAGRTLPSAEVRASQGSEGAVMAEKPATQEPGHIDRRHFLIGGAVLGAGLYVGVRLAGPKLDRGGAADASFEPNAFVRVGSDDSITVIIGKSGMGQGVYNGLAMLLAEGLGVDPARVKVEFGPADPVFNVPWFPAQFTGGSMSTSTCFPTLREAGAKARAMLLAAAAQKWNVEAASLTTDNGVVRHGSRKATYGEFAEAASKLAVPDKVLLKEPAQ